MSYADAWSNAGCTPTGGNAAAYLTAVTDALNHVTHATYNSCTGSMASITDQNNQVTSYAYDLMGRITQINFPDGGRTSRTYFTSSFPFETHLYGAVIPHFSGKDRDSEFSHAHSSNEPTELPLAPRTESYDTQFDGKRLVKTVWTN